MKASLEEINLKEISQNDTTEHSKGVVMKEAKIPKRVLHFSDGILEEFSTDDECDEPHPAEQPMVDPKSLTWISYIWYVAWTAGSKTLAVCDYLGENLAYFFGITSPKYQYEIEEYSRILNDEADETKRDEEERAGWSATTTTVEKPIVADPIERQSDVVPPRGQRY